MADFNLNGFVNEGVITSGLAAPIALGFLPDNRMLLLEKSGQIFIADPNSGEKSLYLDISNVVNSGQERGLLEIAIPPDFDPESTDGKNLIYLFYTRSADTNRAVIGSFAHRERSGGLSSIANPNSEKILWTDTDGYVSCCHYGGGLDFGPDGKLWLTSADKFNTSNGGEGGPDDDWPANLENTSGKIIRINRDGSIPDGSDGWPANPYVDGVIDGPYPSLNPEGQPFQPDPSIWAYGLRNPFRADWDEEYGKFYIGEVGGNQGKSTDDVHIASLDQAGAFYGWNFYEGVDSKVVFNSDRAQFDPADFPQPDGDPADASQGDYFSAPIYDIPHSSLTGGFVYRGTMFPEEFDGVYFFGNYEDSYIKFLDLNETGDVVEGVYDFKPSDSISGATTNIVFLEEGIDGALYYINYAANGGQVQRITFGGNNTAPFVLSSSVTDDQGDPNDAAGTTVPFNITYAATLGDNDTPLDDLTYRINFGDGSPVVNGAPDPVTGEISVNHQYQAEGVYTATLRVRDGANSTFAQPITVTAGSFNTPPEFQSATSDIAFVEPGDPITFIAVVSDADPDDSASSLVYTLDFGDGTQVTGSPDANGRIEVTHTYADNDIYNAFFTISDGEASPVRSDTIPIRVGTSSQLPVTDGLVFQVEAFTKTGLAADGTTVTEWLDQSGSGNNVFAAGDPQLVENATPAGQPAITFDGAGDYFFREDSAGTRLRGLPSANGPRTLFFVVDYEDVTNAEYAGLVYGKAARNQAFGLTLDGNDDDLTVQGWGRNNDLPTDIDGVIDPDNNQQRGFISHAVVFDGTTYRHYLNGAEIDSGTKTFDTVVDKLLIGQNLNGGETPMSVAAALIYDRALNPNEFGAVESYIQQNYLTAPSSNNLPIAVNDPDVASAGLFTTDEDTAFTTGNVLANDSDPDQDTLTISSVETTVTKGLVTNNNDGTFSYDPNGQFASLEDGEEATDSFAYTVSDGNGGDATATVTITISGASEVVNQPPDAVNDSYDATSGQTLSVPFSTGLLQNDTDESPLTIIAVNNQPLMSGNTFSLPNGFITVNEDGSFAYTPDANFAAVESFNYTVSDGTQTDTATVIITVRQPTNNELLVTDGLVAQLESDLNVIEKDGVVTEWLSVAGTNMDLVAAGDPILIQGATPSGQAAISLDGGLSAFGETGAAEGDSLQRVSPGQSLPDLPSGSESRTLYFVVDYKDANGVFSGVSYGKGAENNTFGLTLNGDRNRLTVQGWGRGNDFASGQNGIGNNDGSTGDDWFIHSVRYDGSTIRHYRDDQLVDTASHEFNTIVEKFLIGEEIDGRGFSALDVAAVLVYDKELSDSEHGQTLQYLTQKYLTEQDTSDPNDPPTTSDRVTEDLLALYTFDEGSGTSVKDTSGVGEAIDLSIDDLTGVTWGDGTLTLNDPTLIASDAAATKITDGLIGGDITIETWLTPENTSQKGPARIVTLSEDPFDRNFTLGQNRNRFNTRLRTTDTSNNGRPSLSSPRNTVTTDLTHLVYSRAADGDASIYIDGELVMNDTIAGTFSNWDQDYRLALGNEFNANRAWLGTLDLVAIYGQALDANEVSQNFLAGPDGMAA